MSINNAFREIAIQQTPKQAKFVDALTEEAPFLAAMPTQAATHGMHHVHEKLVDITAATIVDFDDELPQVDLTSKLEQTNLSMIGGTMYVGVDKARQLGGAAKYFNSKAPLILKETGSQTEQSILYNNFRQYGIDNGNVIDIGGASNVNYSIIAVKWSEGEVYGLFDPKGPGNGKVFETTSIWGGNVGKRTFNFEDGSTKELSVYGADVKTSLGVLLANERNVASMVNIDLVNDVFPTEDQMNELILAVRGTPGNTALWMHPKVLTALYRYKSDHLRVMNADNGLNMMLMFWNDIPLMTTYNFLDGTESNV